MFDFKLMIKHYFFILVKDKKTKLVIKLNIGVYKR
jgi:hypothetical protein